MRRYGAFSSDIYLNRCQNAAWGGHKRSCRGARAKVVSSEGQGLSLDDIRERVMSSSSASDNFEETLRWESRIDELLDGQDQETKGTILGGFATAFYKTGKFAKAGPMYGRFAEALGESGCFEIQVQAMSTAAGCQP